MRVPIFESAVGGWPAGELGVAVSREGVVVRQGLSDVAKRRAIAVGVQLFDTFYQGLSSAPPLESGTSNVKPDCCGDLNRESCSKLVEERGNFSDWNREQLG